MNKWKDLVLFQLDEHSFINEIDDEVDQRNYRIIRWIKGSKQGSVIAGGSLPGGQSNQLSCPTVLSFDQHGNLYVVDWENNRVQKFIIEKTKHE